MNLYIYRASAHKFSVGVEAENRERADQLAELTLAQMLEEGGYEDAPTKMSDFDSVEKREI